MHRHLLEVVITEILIASIPMHALYALARSLLTRIVVLAEALAARSSAALVILAGGWVIDLVIPLILRLCLLVPGLGPRRIGGLLIRHRDIEEVQSSAY